MEQIIYVKILVAVVYFLIIGIIAFGLINGLISGKVKQLYRSKGAFTFIKKDSPKEYWRIMGVWAIFFALGIIIGFYLYNKLF